MRHYVLNKIVIIGIAFLSYGLSFSNLKISTTSLRIGRLNTLSIKMANNKKAETPSKNAVAANSDVRQLMGIKGASETKNIWAIRLQLLKPVTWIPLIWGVACGAAASGIVMCSLINFAIINFNNLLSFLFETINNLFLKL